MFYSIVIKKKWIATFFICMILLGTAFFISSAVGVYSLSVAGDNIGIEVPILMYHSVLKEGKQRTYVVKPEVVVEDLAYLKDHGYTTIFVRDLIDYVKTPEGTLPEKPVIITFDDGYLNNLTYVLPILEKLQMKATISIVGEFVDRFSETPDPNLAYGHLTWDDVKTLADSGLVEIGNHTYSMHSQGGRMGCARKKGESVEEYQNALREDVSKLQEKLLEHCGIECNVFTYPFGCYSEESEEVLKELGIEATLSCYEKMNIITKNPEDLYNLKRFNRESGVSTEQFMKRIMK